MRNSKKLDSGPIQLSDPYDLEKKIKEFKDAGYATEYGIAWMSDGQLKHRRQKRSVAISGITSVHYTRCILASSGAWWNIVESNHVKTHLLSVLSPDHALNASNAPDQNLEEWLKSREEEIESWIQEACNESPDFAAFWAATVEAARTGKKNEFNQIKGQHGNKISPYTYASISLCKIAQLSRKFQRKKSPQEFMTEGGSYLQALAACYTPRSKYCTKDFLAGVKAGYAAGMDSLSLRAILANERPLKMAIQTGSGKKSDKRTLWLREELARLEKSLGRKAKTKEILNYIENKIDPVSKERIWIQTLPGDDEKSIQWSVSESWTLKRFQDRIRRIRKK